MNLQYLQGIPGWSFAGDRLLFRNSEDILDEISAAIGRAMTGDTETFAITPEYSRAFAPFLDTLAAGPRPSLVKGQVIGPVTFLTSHVNADGRRLIQDDGYRELVPRCLNMKARYQLDRFRQIHPGLDAVLFFDEPILAEIGSAVTSINLEDVREFLTTAREGLDAKIGVHICGNSDWSFMLGLPLDIVNFDAYTFGEQFFIYRREIAAFLARGGAIALGIVPTDAEQLSRESEVSIIERASAQLRLIEAIGGREAAETQVFFTPSCGMGTLSVAEAEKALTILAALCGQ